MGRKGKDKISVLYELVRLITSSMEPPEVLGFIMDSALKLTGATSGSLLLLDEDGMSLRMVVSRGLPTHIPPYGMSFRLGEGIIGRVAIFRRPILVPDVKKDKRYIELDSSVRSELCVPLILGDRLIGVIDVKSEKIGAFSQDDLRLLKALSGHAAIVINNARLYEMERRRADELSSLLEVGKSIISLMPLEAILHRIVEKAAYLIGAKICSLMLLDEAKQTLSLRAVYGGGKGYKEKPDVPIKGSLIGKAVVTRKPLTVLDVRKEPDYIYKDLAEREGLRSLISIPMMFQDKVIGLINIYTEEIHRFSEDEIRLLCGFADLSAIAINNARIHQRILDLEEKVRELDRIAMVGELSMGIAHEMRNPLTIIKMLLHSEPLTREDIGIISDEIDRINCMIQRLLNYAKGKEVRMLALDLKDVVEDVLLLIGGKLFASNISLEKEMPEEPVNVMGDRDQLVQLFTNIILNAIDAMREGGILRIRIMMEGEWAVSEISDTGPGIPPEISESIFESFVTTKENGFGIGLPIAKRIVERHRGKISFESKQGEGTVFRILLPRREAMRDEEDTSGR